MNDIMSNNTTDLIYSELIEIGYNKYIFFAICSVLIGLPLNILLLFILIKNGLFKRRYQNSMRISHGKSHRIGSFERFLFEIIIMDILLIVYHFMDNFLSYIHQDRSAGQHYLIHISDFCCKFFTYFSKMSVLLTTWLLFFLLLNQLILTIEHNQNYSYWERSLHYINAKYSTVLLTFIFSVYNIYPIEVLKYQKKEDLQDYYQEGTIGVCSTTLDNTSKQLLNATNYGYNLLGISIPCIIISIVSMIIIYRTCQKNTKYNSILYISAIIGLIHSLFNLPSRLSNILLMLLSPYSSFYLHLIYFNHESQSFICLSYTYKCLICIIISRRYRFHAKNILCFLINDKYLVRYQSRIINAQRPCYTKNLQLLKTPITLSTARKFLTPPSNKNNLCNYTLSEAIYWIRPYFTRNTKQHLLRPCGRSVSCQQLSTSDIIRNPHHILLF